MSFAKRLKISITTAADGSATAYSESVDFGRVDTIIYDKPASGGFDNGSTITMTGETTGIPIWAESNVNADAVRAPRQATHSGAGVAALYAAGGTGVFDKVPIVNERIKVVVAAGGNVKTADIYVVLAD